ncbi:DNA polymerase III subunit, partial [bacterium]|nr:DNA polymerase III subunit [bacterium]
MSWDKIKGQEKAIERLKTEIVNDKVTQSYLFSGIEGIGKKLVALEFIKTLNCHSPYLNLSCENCINCNKINKHLHPEVTILTPLNNIISIEQIRNLQRNLALKPLNVKIKSFIIDEAEKFTLESSNCFLKSLEEPPEKVIFILVTSKKSVILPTITSRCKEIKFIPLFKEEQRKILKDWSSKEDVLELLIDLCEGSPGRAKKYLNLNITYWFQQVVSWIPKL